MSWRGLGSGEVADLGRHGDGHDLTDATHGLKA